ncbi:MAG: hypothetical protein Q4D10_01610 [Bacteroidales bacterium]|nr:hypothetical protein [Bacteroidales bacterium]MDO4212818.1 hypothetical protein [Bacteroidales bacterium]
MPEGTHLQDTVTTEPVAIVGIFEAGHGLKFTEKFGNLLDMK